MRCMNCDGSIGGPFGPACECEVVPDYHPPTEVTIPVEEHRRLLKAEKMLDALRNAGVDNWEGYDVAIHLYHQP